jgi:preprotein translocase subunit YajC
MNHLLNILLMAGGDGKSGGSGIGAFLPIILIIVVFYFFMIRPQSKKNKELKKFRENLKRGDKIITVGGIHGKIVDVGETTFMIETEGQTKLKIEKSAVATEYNPNPDLQTK